MKKLFLSFLIIMGVLSVITGPIETHAQPIDAYEQSVSIEPRCIPQPGTRPIARITTFSAVWSERVGGTLLGSLDSGVHVNVLNMGQGRWHISVTSGGIGIIGWVSSSNLIIITC